MLMDQLLEQHQKGRVDFYDLSKGIVYIAVDENDEPIEMLSARLVWQLEPLMRLKKKNGRYASNSELRRATYLLFQEMQNYIATGTVPIRTMIAFIQKRATWAWAKAMQFDHIYRHGRFYRKDL